LDLDSAFDTLQHEGKMRGCYYVRREVKSPVSYEEECWREVVDPDRKRRNLVEEKEKKIEDCKAEIASVNSLPSGRILAAGLAISSLRRPTIGRNMGSKSSNLRPPGRLARLVRDIRVSGRGLRKQACVPQPKRGSEEAKADMIFATL